VFIEGLGRRRLLTQPLFLRWFYINIFIDSTRFSDELRPEILQVDLFKSGTFRWLTSQIDIIIFFYYILHRRHLYVGIVGIISIQVGHRNALLNQLR